MSRSPHFCSERLVQSRQIIHYYGAIIGSAWGNSANLVANEPNLTCVRNGAVFGTEVVVKIRRTVHFTQ